MSERWEFSKRMWNNGGRWLLIAFAYFSIGLSTLIFVLAAAWLWPEDEPYAPIEYVSPQNITTDRTIQVGGSFLVVATVCNHSDEPVSMSGFSNFRRQDGPDLVIPYRQGTRILQPGCTDSNFLNILPPEVTPGIWKLVGRTEVVKGSETQATGWETESFEVVEGPVSDAQD